MSEDRKQHLKRNTANPDENPSTCQQTKQETQQISTEQTYKQMTVYTKPM